MAEKEEKKSEMKNQEQTNPKPSLWQRMKKPLAAGLLGASLLITPMKKAESVEFEHARPPPYLLADIFEKDKDLNAGWRLLMLAYEDQTGKRKIGTETGRLYLQKAIKIFEDVYAKTGRPEALFLQGDGIYSLANYAPTFEETEKLCLQVLELIEKRLKEQPNDFDFLDRKLMIYLNLAEMYRDAYMLHPVLLKARYIDFDKLDTYKKKAREYAEKWLEEYNKIDDWNKLFYSVREKKYTRKEITDYMRSEYEENYLIIKRVVEDLAKH